MNSSIRAEVTQIIETIAAPVIAEQRKPKLKPKTKGRARLLKTESGDIVTHGQLLEGLFKRAEIEIAVQDGKRPAHIKCGNCGSVVPNSVMGPNREYCTKSCSVKAYHQAKKRPCPTPGCGSLSGYNSSTGKCHSCAAKENGRRAWDVMSTDKKHSISIRAASIPSEKRREAALKGHASLTPEQRSEIARKRAASKTPEQRSESARKQHAAKTPEERSNIARKRALRAWETRRRNAEVRKLAEEGAR